MSCSTTSCSTTRTSATFAPLRQRPARNLSTTSTPTSSNSSPPSGSNPGEDLSRRRKGRKEDKKTRDYELNSRPCFLPPRLLSSYLPFFLCAFARDLLFETRKGYQRKRRATVPAG